MSGYASRRVALQTAATGNNDGAVLDATGVEYLGLQVVGITTATINWEATIDGTNWVGVLATNQTTGTAATTATANGLYGMNCAGYMQVRGRISGYSAGTITVTALTVVGN